MAVRGLEKVKQFCQERLCEIKSINEEHLPEIVKQQALIRELKSIVSLIEEEQGQGQQKEELEIFDKNDEETVEEQVKKSFPVKLPPYSITFAETASKYYGIIDYNIYNIPTFDY